MPGKVRVYELARELGIENKDVIDLCNKLGIGVKSHSSSIVEAQADRIRRKAEQEGIAKPPEEQEKATSKKATTKSSKISSKKPPAKKTVVKKSIKPIKQIKQTTTQKSAGSRSFVSSKKSGNPDRIMTPPPNLVRQQNVVSKTASAKSKSSVEKSPVKPIKQVPEKVQAEPKKAPKGKAPLKKPIPPPPARKIPPPPQKRKVEAKQKQDNKTTRPRTGSKPTNNFAPKNDFPPQTGRGGPPNKTRGRGAQRKRKKKSRYEANEEAFKPVEVSTYSAEDAPVPEGVVVVERASSAQDLGPKLNRTAADVVRFLLTNGDMVTATQSLSDEMIELFAKDVGAEIRLVDPGEEQEVELLSMLDFDVEADVSDDPDAVPRPPIITVMGHVDHGKTKLLDYIRSANVVEGEAGGITQHIGAYQIEHNGKKLTFIDTPGHEAFTAMRSRGANATDIVILVVAADDGVMPQTLEAMDHAKAAEVPIIVAINKIDAEGADPQKVMAQLGERGLVPEAWGGETIMCEVSALTGEGVDNLIDNLLLVAEVEDLKANPNATPSGIVLESHLDIGRGPVATVIDEQGTLKVGDPLVTGAAWGRVRALMNDRGQNVDAAVPSMPVQVLGLNNVADAGDKFIIAPSEKIAAKVADTRSHWQRLATFSRDSSKGSGAKLEDIFNQIQSGNVATLNLIVKADVNGSLEAVCDSLKKLETSEVKLSFVLRGVGGITENDVQLAAASNATIIGFNVRPDRKARELAAQEGVEIRNYEIIYKLIEDIQAAMLGMLSPEFEEVVTGEAEVREIFRVPKIGSIAGCMVLNGVITKGSKVRFLREGTIIWKGEIQSLKRFKEDVTEVAAGFECGIGLSDFQDLKEGDIIETYKVEEIARTLEG